MPSDTIFRSAMQAGHYFWLEDRVGFGASGGRGVGGFSDRKLADCGLSAALSIIDFRLRFPPTISA